MVKVRDPEHDRAAAYMPAALRARHVLHGGRLAGSEDQPQAIVRRNRPWFKRREPQELNYAELTDAPPPIEALTPTRQPSRPGSRTSRAATPASDGDDTVELGPQEHTINRLGGLQFAAIPYGFTFKTRLQDPLQHHISQVAVDVATDSFVVVDTNNVQIFHHEKKVKRVQFRMLHHLSALIFVEELRIFIGASLDGFFKFFNGRFELLASVQYGNEAVQMIVYNSLRKELAAAGDGVIMIWSFLPTRMLLGEQLYKVHPRVTIRPTLSMPAVRYEGLTFNTSHGTLYAHWDTNIAVFDSVTGICVQTMTNLHNRAITSVLSYGRRQQVVTASMDCTIKIWSLSNLLEHVFVGHRKGVTAIGLSPVDEILMSVGLDRTVRMWHMDTWHQLYRLDLQVDVLGGRFIGNHQFYIFSHDEIEVWEFAQRSTSFADTSGSGVHQIERVTCPGQPDRILYRAEDNSIRLASPATGRSLSIVLPQLSFAAIRCVFYDRIRETLYVVLATREVYGYDTSTTPAGLISMWTPAIAPVCMEDINTVVTAVPHHRTVEGGEAFDRVMVIGTTLGDLVVANLETGATLRKKKAHGQRPVQWLLAMPRPDGTRIISADKREVKLWTVVTETEVSGLVNVKIHEEDVGVGTQGSQTISALRLSGDIICLGTSIGSAIIFDAYNDEIINDEAFQHSRHESAVTDIDFCAELEIYMTISNDGCVVLRHLDNTVFMEIDMQLHLNACSFLNHQGDILLGINTGIEVIRKSVYAATLPPVKPRIIETEIDLEATDDKLAATVVESVEVPKEFDPNIKSFARNTRVRLVNPRAVRLGRAASFYLTEVDDDPAQLPVLSMAITPSISVARTPASRSPPAGGLRHYVNRRTQHGPTDKLEQSTGMSRAEAAVQHILFSKRSRKPVPREQPESLQQMEPTPRTWSPEAEDPTNDEERAEAARFVGALLSKDRTPVTDVTVIGKTLAATLLDTKQREMRIELLRMIETLRYATGAILDAVSAIAVEDPESVVRIQACLTLAGLRVNDEMVVGALYRIFLHDKEPTVIEAANKALGVLKASDEDRIAAYKRMYVHEVAKQIELIYPGLDLPQLDGVDYDTKTTRRPFGRMGFLTHRELEPWLGVSSNMKAAAAAMESMSVGMENSALVDMESTIAASSDINMSAPNSLPPGTPQTPLSLALQAGMLLSPNKIFTPGGLDQNDFNALNSPRGDRQNDRRGSGSLEAFTSRWSKLQSVLDLPDITPHEARHPRHRRASISRQSSRSREAPPPPKPVAPVERPSITDAHTMKGLRKKLKQALRNRKRDPQSGVSRPVSGRRRRRRSHSSDGSKKAKKGPKKGHLAPLGKPLVKAGSAVAFEDIANFANLHLERLEAQKAKKAAAGAPPAAGDAPSVVVKPPSTVAGGGLAAQAQEYNPLAEGSSDEESTIVGAPAALMGANLESSVNTQYSGPLSAPSVSTDATAESGAAKQPRQRRLGSKETSLNRLIPPGPAGSPQPDLASAALDATLALNPEMVITSKRALRKMQKRGGVPQPRNLAALEESNASSGGRGDTATSSGGDGATTGDTGSASEAKRPGSKHAARRRRRRGKARKDADEASPAMQRLRKSPSAAARLAMQQQQWGLLDPEMIVTGGEEGGGGPQVIRYVPRAPVPGTDEYTYTDPFGDSSGGPGSALPLNRLAPSLVDSDQWEVDAGPDALARHGITQPPSRHGLPAQEGDSRGSGGSGRGQGARLSRSEPLFHGGAGAATGVGEAPSAHVPGAGAAEVARRSATPHGDEHVIPRRPDSPLVALQDTLDVAPPDLALPEGAARPPSGSSTTQASVVGASADLPPTGQAGAPKARRPRSSGGARAFFGYSLPGDFGVGNTAAIPRRPNSGSNPQIMGGSGGGASQTGSAGPTPPPGSSPPVSRPGSRVHMAHVRIPEAHVNAALGLDGAGGGGLGVNRMARQVSATSIDGASSTGGGGPGGESDSREGGATSPVVLVAAPSQPMLLPLAEAGGQTLAAAGRAETSTLSVDMARARSVASGGRLGMASEATGLAGLRQAAQALEGQQQGMRRNQSARDLSRASNSLVDEHGIDRAELSRGMMDAGTPPAIGRPLSSGAARAVSPSRGMTRHLSSNFDEHMAHRAEVTEFLSQAIGVGTKPLHTHMDSGVSVVSMTTISPIPQATRAQGGDSFLPPLAWPTPPPASVGSGAAIKPEAAPAPAPGLNFDAMFRFKRPLNVVAPLLAPQAPQPPPPAPAAVPTTTSKPDLLVKAEAIPHKTVARPFHAKVAPKHVPAPTAGGGGGATSARARASKVRHAPVQRHYEHRDHVATSTVTPMLDLPSPRK